jgi:hypothetical protein
MKSGQTTDFHEFIDKTMLKPELESSIEESRRKTMEINAESKKREFYIQQMRTPMDVCKEYMDIELNISMYSNKKKKECDRKLKMMKENYKWLIEDVYQLKEHERISKLVKTAEQELNYAENYSKIHMGKMCGILLSRGFITQTENRYELTQCGKIAANIHEIHPLIGSQLFLYLSQTPVYSKEIASILSLFVDVKVPDEYKKTYPDTGYLQQMVETIIGSCKEYETIEHEENIITGFNYDTLLQYDLIEDIQEWCDCNTEEQCKYFIQKLKDKISLGDFIKAILKIIVISKEFISICELIGNMEFLSKLKLIEGMISKFIATSQSLYI